MKKRVLFVGENPLGTSGNANMLAAILSDLDHDKYQAACFVVNETNPSAVLFDPLPYTLVNGTNAQDYWGTQRLISLIQETEFDYLCMVGIDFWNYLLPWKAIRQLRNAKRFKWIAIFPYDLWKVQKRWVNYLNDLDYPCVYSQYGYDALKPYIPKLRYYRPRLNGWELFVPYDKEARSKARQEVFPTVQKNKTIFGFVGKNQIRKSPERLVKAFLEAKKVNPEIVLYLHTNMDGYHNLQQIAQDAGAESGDLVAKQPGISYDRKKMPLIYNSMDCLVNCSMQEGLSWTPLEAMLCGTPVIASDTTAQTELVKDAGFMVPCKDISYIPMGWVDRNDSVESNACRVNDIRDALLAVDNLDRKDMILHSLNVSKNWVSGVSNINDLLQEAGKRRKPEKKIEAVLFAQHSSAGDVLITTQCFKGIKERHPDLPLVYMTQKAFAGVVFDNPYLDEIIEWDERHLKRYEVVYNPHGEHILHGGFNSLDVTLHSMYPYFVGVEPDDIFISPTPPSNDIMEMMSGTNEKDRYIVVHTTGGSKEYRTYSYMTQVIKNLKIPVVQLGGPNDLRCPGAIDFCGKLTWRESAWLMQYAKAAVVVDSFISHLAGAVGTNAVVIYGPAPPRVVQPKAQGCKIINLKPDMLKVCKNMTHCWGRNQQCNTPCINTISPLIVKKALEGLL